MAESQKTLTDKGYTPCNPRSVISVGWCCRTVIGFWQTKIALASHLDNCVIVAVEYRRKGLGALLIDQIVAHPELSKVECIQLFCLAETIPFYQKFDFVQAEQSLLVRQRLSSALEAKGN
jgi:N-acetylglutamate synthase-like GNAT family acetyltransferase